MDEIINGVLTHIYPEEVAQDYLIAKKMSQRKTFTSFKAVRSRDKLNGISIVCGDCNKTLKILVLPQNYRARISLFFQRARISLPITIISWLLTILMFIIHWTWVGVLGIFISFAPSAFVALAYKILQPSNDFVLDISSIDAEHVIE